jgi:hypothetical protein
MVFDILTLLSGSMSAGIEDAVLAARWIDDLPNDHGHRLGSLGDCDLRDRGLLPSGADLQPEDGCNHGLPAFAGGPPVEVLCDLGGRLDLTGVELSR